MTLDRLPDAHQGRTDMPGPSTGYYGCFSFGPANPGTAVARYMSTGVANGRYRILAFGWYSRSLGTGGGGGMNLHLNTFTDGLPMGGTDVVQVDVNAAGGPYPSGIVRPGDTAAYITTNNLPYDPTSDNWSEGSNPTADFSHIRITTNLGSGNSAADLVCMVWYFFQYHPNQYTEDD